MNLYPLSVVMPRSVACKRAPAFGGVIFYQLGTKTVHGQVLLEHVENMHSAYSGQMSSFGGALSTLEAQLARTPGNIPWVNMSFAGGTLKADVFQKSIQDKAEVITYRKPTANKSEEYDEFVRRVQAVAFPAEANP